MNNIKGLYKYERGSKIIFVDTGELSKVYTIYEGSILLFKWSIYYPGYWELNLLYSNYSKGMTAFYDRVSQKTARIPIILDMDIDNIDDSLEKFQGLLMLI